MAQRIVFFCDVHEIKGEDAVADESLPYIGFNGNFYKFFWCPECFTTNTYTVAELMAMIEEHGVVLKPEDIQPKRPAAGADKTPGEKSDPCLWCDYTGTTGALNYHLKGHGWRGFKEAFGDVCPMCTQEHPTLGNHGKSHGASSVARLFRMADEAGDVHGIVAGRRKAKAA